jgi:ankyrin repeat protein
MEVVDLLLDRGADPSIKNNRGQTPLEAAESNDQKEAAASLRRHITK